MSLAPSNIQCWQFKKMYTIGKSTSPLIAITATLCNAYSAYQSRHSGNGVFSSFNLYLAAALCVPCIVPFTLLVMEPLVNKDLLRLGTMVETGLKIDESSDEWTNVRSKLIRWKGMNLVRSTIVGVGAIISALAGMAV